MERGHLSLKLVQHWGVVRQGRFFNRIAAGVPHKIMLLDFIHRTLITKRKKSDWDNERDTLESSCRSSQYGCWD